MSQLLNPSVKTIDINYHPVPSQQKIDDSIDRHKITVVTGGRRMGKSEVAVARIIREAYTKPSVVPQNFICLYLMKTERQGEAVVWDRLINLIPKEMLVSHDRGDGRIQIINRYSDYPSTIYLRGANEDSLSNIRGLGVYFLAVDEYMALPVSTWLNILRPMINHPLSRALLIGNIPDPKKEYFDEKWLVFRDLCKSGDDPELNYLEFTSYEGYTDKSEIDRAIHESELLGEKKSAEREYLNIYNISEEFIWKDRFDHGRHVKLYTDLPDASMMRFYCGIDPHVSGDIYIVYLGVTKEPSKKYVYHELLMEHTTVPQTVAEMLRQEKVLSIDPLIRLIDPKVGTIRNKLQNIPTIKEQFELEGMLLYLGVSDFMGFKLCLDTDLDQGNIIFSSSCSGTIKEIYNHRWETRKSRLTLNDPKLKERGEYNHFTAALKYIYNQSPVWVERSTLKSQYQEYKQEYKDLL